MTTRSLGVLLLKIWGLSSLVFGAIALIHAGLSRFGSQRLTGEGAASYFMISMTSGVTNLVLGVLLLIFAKWITSLLVSHTDDANGSGLSITAVELQCVVFGGVAVVLGIKALQSISQLIYTIATQPSWDEMDTFEYLLTHDQEQLVGATVQLIASVVLLVTRHRLSSRLELPAVDDVQED
jgi:hypothetical protein